VSGHGADWLHGGSGDDVLRSSSGGSDGHVDTVIGGTGNDTYHVTAEDQVTEAAGEGRDTVVTKGDSYTLGANLEDLSYDANGNFTGTGNTLANLVKGRSGNDILNGLAGADTLQGGEGHDTLDGGTEADRIEADGGNDSLLGGGGADLLDGAHGNDVMQGGTEADTLTGGMGDDTLGGDAGMDLLQGGDHDDRLAGGGEADTLQGEAGADTLYGGIGNDLVEGGSEADRLFGDAGADTLFGGDGGDRIVGGAGNDWLEGGLGNDRLDGGHGRDTLQGQQGADTFIWTTRTHSTDAAPDYVLMFDPLLDRIDLSAMDANTTTAANDAFNWTLDRPTFTSAGDLWRAQEGDRTFLRADMNGDGAHDFEVEFFGLYNFQQSVFIL
jgi:Ca2+-binding RTX toxin-like protein